MRAIVFDQTGHPEEVLQLIEKEKPVPADQEVLVKIRASPINPSDLFFIQGAYRIAPEFPNQIAGFEGVGIVESTGKNVSIPIGALVAFFSKKVWAEYASLPAEDLTVLPNDFPIGKGAQFTLNPFTAWGLLDTVQTVKGEWMLLTGANSSVSRILIQLARQRGVHSIALVRDISQAPNLRAIGTNEVFLMDDKHLSENIKRLTNGKGFDLALDAIGGAIGTFILENIAPFGRFVLYGAIKKEPAQYFNAQLVYKNLLVKGFGIRDYLNNQTKEQRAAMVQDLISEMGKPSFNLPVTKTYGLDQFKEALKENSQNGRTGKILFQNF